MTKQSDGDLDHPQTITIENLDNLGWFVQLQLKWTKLEDLHFDLINIDRSENDWIRCVIEDNVFKIFLSCCMFLETGSNRRKI